MVSRAQFDAVAKKLFDTFGDLIEDVTYAVPGTWNPVTETQTPASSETIRLTRREFSRAEQFSPRGAQAGQLDIMTGDLEALIIQTELTATPAVDDTVTMDGRDYLVRAVGNVQEILWRLQLRLV